MRRPGIPGGQEEGRNLDLLWPEASVATMRARFLPGLLFPSWSPHDRWLFISASKTTDYEEARNLRRPGKG
jgi:hypothetical protein